MSELRRTVRRLASSDGAKERALVALVVLPIAIAVVHAAAGNWYPIGDDAYFSLRGRDVFTRHHPWLGTWTSASQLKGINFNNPGPLFFDLLALPSKASRQLGPAVATGVLAAMSAGGSVVVARRNAGWSGALLTALGLLGLMWAMGSSVLVQPWQPHSMMLPFVFFVTCSWAMAAGRAWAALPAVAAGSLLLQTHLGYLILVPAVLGVAIVLLVAAHRRAGPARRSLARWLVASMVLGLALWAQPILEQVAGEGEGNLTRMATASTSETDAPSVGLGRGVRLLAALVAPWPEWGRGGFDDIYAPNPPLEDPVAAIVTLDGVPSPVGAGSRLVGVAALIAAGFLLCRRRQDRVGTAGLWVLTAMLLASVGTLAILPINPDYVLPVHQLRWLWPIAVMATVWVAGSLLGPSWPRPVLVAAIVVAAAGAIGAAVPYRQPVGPVIDDFAMPVMRALAPQLEAADVEGPLVLEEAQLRVFEPFSISVVLELDGRGVEVVSDDPGLIRQLGEARAATGLETERLLILQGVAPPLPTGGRVIAQVDGISGSEDRTRRALAGELGLQLRAGDVVLTERGRRAIDLRQITIDGIGPGPHDLRRAQASLSLAQGVQAGFVTDRLARPTLEAWSALEHARDRATVRVVVAPL